MKKSLILCCIITAAFTYSLAQTSGISLFSLKTENTINHTITNDEPVIKSKMPKQERLFLSYFFDVWTVDPKDAVPLGKTHRGFSMYGMWDNPIGKSNFSIAAGIGFSSHNMYTSAMPGNKMTVDGIGNIITEQFTTFYDLPEKLANGEVLAYKKSKMNFTYLDIPIEFRMRTQKDGQTKFRLAIGAKAGMLVGSKYKYKGDDFVNDTEHKLKMKIHDTPYLLPYRYGATFRIGYEHINLLAYYGLSELFEKDKGHAINHLSIGMVLMPF